MDSGKKQKRVKKHAVVSFDFQTLGPCTPFPTPALHTTIEYQDRASMFKPILKPEVVDIYRDFITRLLSNGFNSEYP